MAPVMQQFTELSKLFQQVSFPEMMKTLGAVQPQDVALLLKSVSRKRRPKGIPPINSDFYDIAGVLTDDERVAQVAIRRYMEQEVQPVVNDYWERGEFPHQLVPGFAQVISEVVGANYYDNPAVGPTLTGILCMEIARVDASMCTFFGVHWGLCMGSIALFGSPEQKERWLPAMERFEKIGSWALTEPAVGSATAAGLKTTAKREGDTWIINGEKKWSGNAPFADVNVIWARDLDDGQVKGFLVERDTPGYEVRKLEGKIAMRMVQNANITLTNCRVDESSRLPGVTSFRDIARQLATARAIVAWQAVGVAMGAYEHALNYANNRMQFGRPITSFQLVQNSLVQMLGNITAMQAMMLRLSQLETRDGTVSHERASLAKMFCGEKMRETVALARNVLGGNGILLEHNVARFFADAEALYSYEGTHEMNTLIVGRAITGVSAFV